MDIRISPKDYVADKPDIHVLDHFLSQLKIGGAAIFQVQTATSHQPFHPGLVCHYPGSIYPV